jgi:hypothetical protein
MRTRRSDGHRTSRRGSARPDHRYGAVRTARRPAHTGQAISHGPRDLGHGRVRGMGRPYVPPMTQPSMPRRRQRNSIETLPSGSLRVKVYSGVDPSRRRSTTSLRRSRPGRAPRRKRRRSARGCSTRWTNGATHGRARRRNLPSADLHPLIRELVDAGMVELTTTQPARGRPTVTCRRTGLTEPASTPLSRLLTNEVRSNCPELEKRTSTQDTNQRRNSVGHRGPVEFARKFACGAEA